MATLEADEIAKISKEIALYELIGKQYGLSSYHDAILQRLRLKRMRLEIERIERRMKKNRQKKTVTVKLPPRCGNLSDI